METSVTRKPVWLRILRWTARIVALVFVIFFLVMFIGESAGTSARHAPLYWRDYFLLSLWGITIIGLLIGLCREGLGGLISLIATSTHFIYLTWDGVRASIFLIILIPSILYIMSWYFNKRTRVKSGAQ